MECPKCLDTRGLCAHDKVLKDNYFYLRLPEDFKDMTFIPCFARNYLLKKLDVAMTEETTVTANLETKEGFYFKVMVRNEKDRTFFVGPTWKAFAKVYEFEVGMKLYLDIGQPGLDIAVELANRPITHPSYYQVPNETRRVVDNMYATDGTTVTWEEMRYVISFVNSIEWLVDTYHAGPRDGPYVPLVHTLNKSNIVKKLLKLPRRVVPELMDEYGEMTIIVHPEFNFRSTYSTSEADGRVIVNGWRELLRKYEMEIGGRLICVLHHGRAGAFLFVTSIPDDEE